MNKVTPAKNGDRPIRIILVEDDPVILETTKQLLENLGYIVTSAQSSSEAIELIKEYHDVFDVMTTDYSLPGMNGLELAKLASKILVDTPIILYTGTPGLIDKKQIDEAGIAELVNKPFRIRDLDMIIKRILGITLEASL